MTRRTWDYFPPPPKKKDQCDVCVGHTAGNITDAKWQDHVAKKNEARAEKTKDKESAQMCMKDDFEGEKVLVLTMDVQAVLLSPSLKASALYYKTKLAVHNFTIFNLANSHVTCYV